MVARQRDVVVLRGREQHLEQLQRAGGEGRDRPRQIQPPHAHELLIEHAAHAVHVGFEQRQPVNQRTGVVQPQVLDIQH